MEQEVWEERGVGVETVKHKWLFEASLRASLERWEELKVAVGRHILCSWRWLQLNMAGSLLFVTASESRGIMVIANL